MVADIFAAASERDIYTGDEVCKKYSFFPGPLAFCKKAVERVNSEKNILNSSVECVEWSGVVFFRKSYMYVHHQIRLNELINMMYFIFNLNTYFSRN